MFWGSKKGEAKLGATEEYTKEEVQRLTKIMSQ